MSHIKSDVNIKTKNAGLVTARLDFFPSGDKALFSVNEGVPMGDAFDQLTVLVRCSQQAAEAMAMTGEDGGCESGAHWPQAHVLTFAYALVQSMHQGYVSGQDKGRAIAPRAEGGAA